MHGANRRKAGVAGFTLIVLAVAAIVLGNLVGGSASGASGATSTTSTTVQSATTSTAGTTTTASADVSTTTAPAVTTTLAGDASTSTTVSVDAALAQAMADLQAAVTITRADLIHPDVKAVAQCTDDRFLYNSLAGLERGNPAKLQDTDSVTLPFVAVDDVGKAAEARTEICQNPVVLDMMMCGFGQDDLVINGKTLRALNPWIDEWFALAGPCGSGKFTDVGKLLVPKEVDGKKVLFVRPEVQEYAMLVNAVVFGKAQLIGVKSGLLTSSNWHLEGAVEGALPRTALNQNQYTGNFLVWEFTAKGFGCVKRFGLNAGLPNNPLGDKRFATFVCETPIPVTPPSDTTPPSHPGPTPTTTGGTPTTGSTGTTAPPNSDVPTTTPTQSTTPTNSSTPGKAVPAHQQPTPASTVAPATTQATLPPLAPPDPTPSSIDVVNPAIPVGTTDDGVRDGTPTPSTSIAVTPVNQPKDGGPTPTMA